MNCSRALIWLILSLLIVSLAGCFSSNPKDINAFLMPNKVDVSARNYILHPPDEIEIHCTDVPEIHMQRQQIRPDGIVSFEGLGELYAAGKTPAQMANELRGKVLDLYQADLVNEKSVDVRVVAFRSKRFYVLGMVGSPGAQVYTGRDTIFGAIALAGSPTVLAWADRIQIIRPSSSKNVKAKIFEFNYDRAAVHGDASKDVLLQEGDIIYVPPTILAAAAMKIEEFIRPIARAFSGYYLVTETPAPYGAAATGGGFGAISY